MGRTTICSSGWDSPPLATCFLWALLEESKQRSFFGVLVGLAVFFSGDKPGFGPAAELLSFASPKESNQRKGEPRPCRFAVPCATRKMEHPRSGFAASPSRGRHQRPGKAGSAVSLVGAALREPRTKGLFASLTSRSWVASFLTPHFSQGHGTPCHYSSLPFPHSSPLISHHGQPQGLPLRPLKTDAEPKLRHSALDAESGHTTPTAPRAKTPPHSPHHFSRFASLAQASMSAALLTIAPHRPPTPACNVSAANEPFGRGSRSGRAVWYSKPPLGRAEQRSSVRIKTLALFERSEFASVPNAASSARNPKGTDVARLFFGYFFLAKQKKVTRPPGRDPACNRSTTQSAQQKTKKNLSLPTSPQQRQ